MKNYIFASLLIVVSILSFNFAKGQSYDDPVACATLISQKDQVITQLINFISNSLPSIAKTQSIPERSTVTIPAEIMGSANVYNPIQPSSTQAFVEPVKSTCTLETSTTTDNGGHIVGKIHWTSTNTKSGKLLSNYGCPISGGIPVYSCLVPERQITSLTDSFFTGYQASGYYVRAVFEGNDGKTISCESLMPNEPN